LRCERIGIAPGQDFTGVCAFSAVNSVMINQRALVVVLGLFSFCAPLGAQQTSRLARSENALEQLSFYRPEILRAVDGSSLLQNLPIAALMDGQYLPGSSEWGRIGGAPATNYSTAFVTVAPSPKAKGSQVDPKDFSDEIAVQPNRYYYGGEVGFMYGHASGKFGGDEFSTYILGDVGNDKFQINVGASYDEWNGHSAKFRSFGFPR